MKIKRTSIYQMLYLKSGDRCHYCGVGLNKDNRTIDHIKPKNLGGNNDFDNLVIACKPCNSSKGKYSIDEFRLRKSFEHAGCPFKFSAEQIKWLLSNFNDEFVGKTKKFRFFKGV